MHDATSTRRKRDDFFRSGSDEFHPVPNTHRIHDEHDEHTTLHQILQQSLRKVELNLKLKLILSYGNFNFSHTPNFDEYC